MATALATFNRAASVWTGGKRYHYSRLVGDDLQRIWWDRRYQVWRGTVDAGYRQDTYLYTGATAASVARQFVAAESLAS